MDLFYQKIKITCMRKLPGSFIYKTLLVCMNMAIGIVMLKAQDQDLSRHAFELAWQKKYKASILEFKKLIDLDSSNTSLWAGMGYAYAWDQNFDKAEDCFLKIYAMDPANLEAQKGLAYLALWKKDYQQALQKFQFLNRKNPSEEFLLGELHAYMIAGQIHQAREAVGRIESEEKRRVLERSIQAIQAPWEVWLWTGSSRFQKWQAPGIRAGQITWQSSPKSRFWMRFDNSLSQDNAAFLLRDIPAVAYLAGMFYAPLPDIGIQLEIGQRNLSVGTSQLFIQHEETFFVLPKTSIKIGGLYLSESGKYLNQMWSIGLNQELMNRFWIEPILYLAWEESLSFDQFRLSVQSKYQFRSGQELLTGLAYGKQSAVDPPINKDIVSAWIQLQYPIAKKHWIAGIFRYEQTPAQNFLNASLGLRLRLE